MVMGALRHLLGCSLPHNSTGRRESDSEFEASPEEKQELQDVWRHLEVRWQMFNEALIKFCDLEALLALCTDDVVWSSNKGDLTRGKDKEPLLFLHSLITHKLSLEVEVERVTKLTSSGCLGLALDKDGNSGKLSGSETHKENETLDMFLPTRKRHELDGAGSGDYLPLMVLERDFYILYNDQGLSRHVSGINHRDPSEENVGCTNIVIHFRLVHQRQPFDYVCIIHRCCNGDHLSNICIMETIIILAVESLTAFIHSIFCT